jgi:hypothetical protein
MTSNDKAIASFDQSGIPEETIDMVDTSDEEFFETKNNANSTPRITLAPSQGPDFFRQQPERRRQTMAFARMKSSPALV